MTDTTDTTNNTTPTPFQPGDDITGARIDIIGAQWFDRINGNTYCSARVYINNDLVLYVPFQYGYGDFYRQAALEDLVKAGYLTTDDGDTFIGWQHADEHGYTVHASLADTAITRQRDVKAWGRVPR